MYEYNTNIWIKVKCSNPVEKGDVIYIREGDNLSTWFVESISKDKVLELESYSVQVATIVEK
jgi:hypothetical protein